MGVYRLLKVDAQYKTTANSADLCFGSQLWEDAQRERGGGGGDGKRETLNRFYFALFFLVLPGEVDVIQSASPSSTMKTLIKISNRFE